LQEDLVQAYVRLTGSFDADMYNFNSVLSDYNPAGPDTGSFQEFQFYRAKSFTGKHTRKMVGYHYQSHAGTNPIEASAELIQNAASTTKYGLYSEIIILESKSLTTKLIEAFFNEESFAKVLMAPSIEFVLFWAWTDAAEQINKINNVICFKLFFT